MDNHVLKEYTSSVRSFWIFWNIGKFAVTQANLASIELMQNVEILQATLVRQP
jgi:hypothetical protein